MCKLNNAIYGLKQAPRVWFDRLKPALVTIGYQSTKSDSSLFIKSSQSSSIYILIYVDDLIITGDHQNEINQIICYLDKQFSIKDLGHLNNFLGVEVCRQKILR